MDVNEARKHSAIARKHLDKVQTAAWEPNPESAVTWAFYAYENCLAALAARYGRKLTKNHHEKAELARKLYADGLISRDVGCNCSAIMSSLTVKRKCPHEGACDIDAERADKASGSQQFDG